MKTPRRRPDRATLNARYQRALELRQAGLTYSQIADALGYKSTMSAWCAVESALNRRLVERGRNARSMDAARLDDLLKAVWAQALEGNEKAIDRALRILQRRAQLLGLDAPAARARIRRRDAKPALHQVDPGNADQVGEILDVLVRAGVLPVPQVIESADDPPMLPDDTDLSNQEEVS